MPGDSVLCHRDFVIPAVLMCFLALPLRNNKAAARTRAEMNGQLRTNRFVSRNLSQPGIDNSLQYHPTNHQDRDISVAHLQRLKGRLNVVGCWSIGLDVPGMRSVPRG